MYKLDLIAKEVVMLKQSFIILLVVFMAGFSLAMDPANTDADPAMEITLPAVPQGGQAMVYMVRPSVEDHFSKFYVFLDQKKGENRIGNTKGLEYLYFQVAPGKHRIFSEGRNSKYIDIDVKPGEIIFIKQPVKRDVDGSNLDNMIVLEPDLGKYMVSHLTLGRYDQH